MKATRKMSVTSASVVIGVAGFMCIMAVAGAGGGVAQDNEPARPERPWPVAVDLADVRMTGELSKRLTASFI